MDTLLLFKEGKALLPLKGKDGIIQRFAEDDAQNEVEDTTENKQGKEK